LKQSEQNLAEQTAKLTLLNNQLTNEIAERKKIEKALRKQEKRYHETLDGMFEGCQIIGFGFEYIYVNESAAKHGRTTRESLLNKTMMQVYPGIEKTPLFKYIKRSMNQRTVERLENKFVYPDGTSAWFDLSIQPVPEGVFILSQDISKRKNADKEIKNLNAKLIDRNNALINLNNELEAFSYSVSHDLQAPLRGIDGFSQILYEDYNEILDDQAKDYLQRIRKGISRMHQLINDILRLSRITRTEIQYEKVDLTTLSQSVIKKLKNTNPHRKIETKIQKNMVVEGDKKLLEIVLENLIRNAWKFTSKTKRPEIEIGITKQDNEKVFFIKDNGVGFDMKYEEKLFTPFQRLHSDDEFQGTGIGLAIVQRIIRKHNGLIWAKSQVGKGATFFFKLPNKE
jgi:PAS domain S-box-containing protein